MRFTILYRATGSIYYVRFVQQKNSGVWDSVANAITALPTWDDSIIELVEVVGLGIYPIEIPADLPRGIHYDVVIYKQDGSNPADSDDVEIGFVLKHGTHGF